MGNAVHFLLVSHHAGPHIGGVENLVRQQAEALLAAGHRVTWITSDGTGAGEAPTPHERFELIRVAACHWPERFLKIAYPLFAPSLVWRLWRAVGEADVVHAHGLVFLGSPLATGFARLRGKWSLCTDHGGLLHYRLRVGTLLLRLLFATVGRCTARAADRLIAYNAEVQALLQRLGGAEKVQFLANPMPDGFRPPTADERAAARALLGWDDTPRVLCVGRLLPHKGIDLLLSAQRPGWRQVFCGPADEAMRQRIAAAGAEYLPARPQADLRDLYHAADLFALPSYNEGFPVVVQEALSCGLPVLTSDAEAYAPYRGTPGLHFTSLAPDAVAARIGELLATMSGRARAIAPAPTPAVFGERDGWLAALLPPSGFRRQATPVWLLVAAVLLIAHLLLTAIRLPGRVGDRRAADVARYREQGAPRYLLGSAQLGGSDVLTWLLANAPADAALLWRWPADGALEFAPALLQPRLIVDERLVPVGATTAAGRPLFQATLPDGQQGFVVLQGTDDRGLRLAVRVR